MKQKKNIHRQQQPQNKTIQTPLTEQECLKLIQTWSELHLAPFNEWCQISQSIPVFTYEKINLDFKCNIELLLNNKETINQSAVAKSKKDAKKLAILQMTHFLCQNKIIHLGLKQGTLQSNSQNPSEPLLNQTKSSHPSLLRLHRLIRDRIQDNDFEGACEGLCLIEMIKDKWEWHDICFVWCYALQIKSLRHLKVIIDIIQIKNISDIEKFQLKQVEDDIGYEEAQAVQLTNQVINKHYGDAHRLASKNPYDMIDYYNVIVNNPDIQEDLNIDQQVEDKIISNHQQGIYSQFIGQQNMLNSEQHKFLNSQISSEELNEDFQIKITQNQQINQENNIEQNNEINKEENYEMNKEQIQYNNQQNELISQETPQILSIIYPDPELQKKIRLNQNVDQIEKDLQLQQNEFDYEQNNQHQIQQFYHQEFYEYVQKNQQNTIQNKFFPNINNQGHINYQLLNEMYNVLYYIQDLSFCLQVSELLYTSIQLDESLFTCPQACAYYAHKKNMIFCEQLESILQVFNKIKKGGHGGIQGKLSKVGERQAQYVMEFNSIEPQEMIKQKIGKSGQLSNQKELYGMICEGEWVFVKFETTYEVAKVQEIGKNYELKLFMQVNKEEIVTVTRIFNGSSLEKTQEGLIQFTTRLSMNPDLYNIIISPPISNKNKIKQLAVSKVAPQRIIKAFNNLNQSQNEALSAASTNLLTLIQGPPGQFSNLELVKPQQQSRLFQNGLDSLLNQYLHVQKVILQSI